MINPDKVKRVKIKVNFDCDNKELLASGRLTLPVERYSLRVYIKNKKRIKAGKTYYFYLRWSIVNDWFYLTDYNK